MHKSSVFSKKIIKIKKMLDFKEISIKLGMKIKTTAIKNAKPLPSILFNFEKKNHKLVTMVACKSNFLPKYKFHT